MELRLDFNKPLRYLLKLKIYPSLTGLRAVKPALEALMQEQFWE